MGDRMKVAAIFALALLASLPAWAESEHPGSSHEYHRNHFGVFVGGATRPEDVGSESGFTFGLDYEFRFVRWVGLGVLGEVATGDVRAAVVGVPIFLHPWRGLKVIIAPGAEFSDHGTEFAFRLGASYQFPLGDRFTLAPEFNADVIDGEATYVYGLSVGIGF